MFDSNTADSVELLDLQPESGDFLSECLAGLSARPPQLPCKYFYDERGAQRFEQICELPEYYPTRTEVAILRQHLSQMSALIGPKARIVEYGSGAGLKIRLLLQALAAPAAYTPVDIAREQLVAAAASLQREFPAVEVLPVCADYSSALALPHPGADFAKTLVFFPGSTIGNFAPAEALAFLRRFAQLAAQGGEPGGLLIGVDLKKDPRILERAYNDSAGVTADFNLNLLARINRELGADFDLAQWRHRAHWNDASGAIEMHLISERAQRVRLNGHSFDFGAGDSIHTENSFKYDSDDFAELAGSAGFVRRGLWSDAGQLFSVQYYELSP